MHFEIRVPNGTYGEYIMSESTQNFEFYGNEATTSTSDTPRVEVDWSKLNEHVVDAVDCKTPQTVVGVISQIVDLGLQNQEDAKFVNKDDAETMAKNIADGRCYYEEGDELDQKGNPTGNTVTYKRWVQKAIQQVALVVDFPEILVDKGQFFGESKPLPYRLVMGGQYWDKNHKEMILQRPISLKLMKNHKDQWSLSDKNTVFKMAVAADLIEAGGAFTPNRLGDLLGKAFLFEIQTYINAGGYLNERILFKGKLMRGQEAPEYTLTPKIIGFNANNDIDEVGMLRKELINSMQRALNWNESNIKKQLEQVKQREMPSKETGAEQESAVTQTPTQAKPAVKTGVVRDSKFEDNFDDDIPFINPLRGKRAMLV